MHLYYGLQYTKYLKPLTMARILVGDDDTDIRELFEHLIKAKNHDVATAASRNDVLKALESFTPDLIMLDVMFGMDDGRELCRTIKTTNSQVKIILLSANPELLKSHIEYNADAVVEKPFSAASLFALIDKSLSLIPGEG